MYTQFILLKINSDVSVTKRTFSWPPYMYHNFHLLFILKETSVRIHYSDSAVKDIKMKLIIF
jgi:hypothetical protein